MFENTVIGSGAKIEEDVSLGFKVNEKCGPTLIGKNCFLRKGTVIYGDVKIGDYFQSQREKGNILYDRSPYRLQNRRARHSINPSWPTVLQPLWDGVSVTPLQLVLNEFFEFCPQYMKARDQDKTGPRVN